MMPAETRPALSNHQIFRPVLELYFSSYGCLCKVNGLMNWLKWYFINQSHTRHLIVLDTYLKLMVIQCWIILSIGSLICCSMPLILHFHTMLSWNESKKFCFLAKITTKCQTVSRKFRILAGIRGRHSAKKVLCCIIWMFAWQKALSTKSSKQSTIIYFPSFVHVDWNLKILF